VESSLADTPGDTVAERSITMPRLCMEIIEDIPRMADSEPADSRVAGMVQPQVTAMQVTDMRARLEATRGRPAASRAIAVQRLTAAPQGTEPTQATGDSPAATDLSLDADPAHRGLVVSAAAAAVRRADSLRMEPAAVRTVAATLAVDMPAVDTAAVDMPAVAAEVTAAADTAAGANPPV
jgi:hypothetical protein